MFFQQGKSSKIKKFATIPIIRVKREHIVKYLESLKSYSASTIKQVYELICMAFGQSTYENILTNNFMEGYKRVEKQFDINEFDKEEPEIDDEIGM